MSPTEAPFHDTPPSSLVYSTFIAACLALVQCSAGDDFGITCSPAPHFSSTPPTTATVGQQYIYVVDAAYVCGIFVCGDYYPIQLPPDTNVSMAPKYISWTPSAAQADKDILFSLGTGPDTCGDRATQSWTVHVSSAIPSAYPGVTLVYPSDGANYVPLNSMISASFNKPIDTATVTSSSFKVSDTSGPISGSLSVSDNNITFTPTALMSAGQVNVTITTAVKDLAGNAMQADYSWHFFAGNPPDTIPPITPSGLTATRVTASEVNLSWSATFDNVGVAGYRLYRDGALIKSVTPVLWTWDAGLTFGTAYSYSISAYDVAGNESPPSGLVWINTLDFLPGNAAKWGHAYHKDGTYWQRTVPDVAVGCTNSCYGWDNIVAISLQGDQSVAALSDGTILQWDLYDPLPAFTIDNVTDVASGMNHTLAIDTNGMAWSWGNNAYGQLGDGTLTSSTTPVQMANLSQILAVAGGVGHTLALKSDGTVWAAGGNWFGQLGDGTTVEHDTAVQIPNLNGVIAIAAAFNQSLALKSDGTVWRWGGTGPTSYSATPTLVANLPYIVAISQGIGFALAVAADGTVWSWGLNGSGQLGDGTNITRASPVQVAGMTNVIAVSAGDNHSLALKADGTVWSWGANGDGQLGDASTVTRYMAVQVKQLTQVKAIAAGQRTSMALK